jgi:hypothetical protein
VIIKLRYLGISPPPGAIIEERKRIMRGEKLSKEDE